METGRFTIILVKLGIDEILKRSDNIQFRSPMNTQNSPIVSLAIVLQVFLFPY